MLFLNFSQPNLLQRQDSYLATAMYGGHLFIAKGTDFQNSPRFESKQDRSTECSSNCNASRHNINLKLKLNSEDWYKTLSNVPK